MRLYLKNKSIFLAFAYLSTVLGGTQCTEAKNSAKNKNIVNIINIVLFRRHHLMFPPCCRNCRAIQATHIVIQQANRARLQLAIAQINI